MANPRPPQKLEDSSSTSEPHIIKTHPSGRLEVREVSDEISKTLPFKSVSLQPIMPSSTRPENSELAKSKKNAHSWHLNLIPDALDRLREHPEFDLHGERAAQDQNGHIIPARSISEDDREALFRLELLRIFRERMLFLSTLALYLVPLFTFVYGRLLPATKSEVLFTAFLCFGVSLVLRMLSHRVLALWQARFLTLLSFALYAVAAGVLVALMDQNQFDNQYAIYYAHNYIMLSVLLLPFTLVETFIVGVILMASLAWSAWWASPPDMSYFYASQLFVLGMTIFLVLCIAHFQSLLRRHAFDAAFDLARSAARLGELSTTDVVTGGYNRLQVEQTLAFEIARASRFERPLSLIMFDLDNFKKVNDTHGHAAGDEILREVWRAAMHTIREIDTVARYGGDEFLIALPETSTDAAYAVAERLQEEVQTRFHRLFTSASPESCVTLSIGVLTYHDSQPTTVEDLISRADARLYQAKHNGKNCIV